MVDEEKRVAVIRTVIMSLDILLAILIVVFSSTIITTKFGAYSISFGFVMLILSLGLRLAQRW